MNAKKATTNVCGSRTFGTIAGWVAMLVSVQAYALTLGEFEVDSALDEPLKAEITLRSVEPEILESLEVTLGTPEDFRRADVPRSEFLQRLQFSVEKKGSDAIVVVTTDQPVKEPFLHFLISAEWSGGKLVREYTGLLDPPLYAEQSPSMVESPNVAQIQPSESSSTAASSTTGSTMGEESAPTSPSTISVTSGGRSAEYGPTREGDTLWSIASRLDTGDVRANVFQIMIALQRQNPDAFIDNNINRLKTGQILRLDNLSSLASIAPEEASIAYTAQLEEWEGYRSRVAGASEEVRVPAETASAADAPESGATAGDQAATDTAAADTATSTGQQPSGDEDVLRIVQATVEGTDQSENASAGTDQSGELAALQSQIATLEESLESRNLENDELRERVQLLESQLENAQRLIEIESQELAAAQQQAAEQLAAAEAAQAAAEAAQAEASAAQQVTAEPVEPVQATDQQESSTGAQEQATGQSSGGSSMEADAAENTPEPASESASAQQASAAAATQASQGSQQASAQSNDQKVRKVSTRPPQGNGAWWSQIPDMLFSSWMWMVGAGLGVLVLVLGLLMFLRRRQSIAEFEESILSGSALDSYSETTDTAGTSASDTSFLSDFGTAGMGTMQADEVDPLAEAEVYLAYGRDEQAEDVLKEAARRDPERSEIKLKLLEIYKQRNDVKSFETIAEELYPAGDQGDTEVWRQVSAMGRELSPNNPLFQEDTSAPAGGAAAEPAAAGDDNLASAGEPGGMDFDFDELAREQNRGAGPAFGSETVADADESDEDLGSELQAAPPPKQDDNALEFSDDFMERSSRSVDPSTQPFPAPDQQTDLDRELDRLVSEREAPAAPAAVGADEETPSRDVSWDRADTDDATLDFSARDTSEIEFDLNLDDSSIQHLSGSDAGEAPAQAGGEDRASGDNSDGLLEFSSDNIPPEETWAGPSSDATPVGDDDVSYQPTDDVSSSGAPAYNEAETKLDLARAYLDMGDKVGARSIIDEVMREGDPAQRDRAAELASQL